MRAALARASILRALVLAALALGVIACGRSMRWEYVLPDALSGSDMIARVRAGGCGGGTIVYEQPFLDGGSVPDGPVLGAGTYGVELEVLGDACDVVARGCEEITLPAGDSVRVTVAAITPEAACAPALCVDGACMRVDAGTDAGVLDAPRPDIGMGDECTTGVDCPCGGDACESGRCVPDRAATEIEAGTRHACAIAEGRLYCWGRSAVGETGTGNYDDAIPAPARVGGDSDWTDLSILGQHSCGVRGATVTCWGSNNRYQGGADPAVIANILDGPRPFSLPVNVTRVSAGMFHTLGLDTISGTLAAWGDNGHLESGGDTETDNPLSPRGLPALWRDASAGRWFSCGVQDDGGLYCWGGNFGNVLGSVGCTDCGPRQIVMPGIEWARVEAGIEHACVWDAAGALHCWGSGVGGRLGVGGPAPSSTSRPTRVPGIVATRASLSRHTCVIDADTSLWCFGPNESGQIGDGTTADALDPVRIDGAGWTDVAAGDQNGDGPAFAGYTCGVRGGAIFCWGSGLNHTLGLNDGDASHPTPQRVCLP